MQLQKYNYIVDFEWDEKKDEANRLRHHISFEDARYVFADPFAVTRADYTEDEPRWQIMGHIGTGILVLAVYAMRRRAGQDVIRIISARKATSQEKRRYENNTWV